MLLKIGIAPFHNWFLPLSFNRNFFTIWLLLTWQKIPYLILLFFIMRRLNPIFLILLILRSLISSTSNLKQNTLKIILIFSGISQIAWITISTNLNAIWEFFFIIYIRLSLLRIPLIEKVIKKEQLKGQSTNYLFFILMRFGGLPPLIMFYPKISIIYTLLKLNLVTFIFTLLVISLLDLYVYSRISIIIIFKKIKRSKWLKKKEVAPLPVLIWFTVMANIFFI